MPRRKKPPLATPLQFTEKDEAMLAPLYAELDLTRLAGVMPFQLKNIVNAFKGVETTWHTLSFDQTPADKLPPELYAEAGTYVDQYFLSILARAIVMRSHKEQLAGAAKEMFMREHGSKFSPELIDGLGAGYWFNQALIKGSNAMLEHFAGVMGVKPSLAYEDIQALVAPNPDTTTSAGIAVAAIAYQLITIQKAMQAVFSDESGNTPADVFAAELSKQRHAVPIPHQFLPVPALPGSMPDGFVPPKNKLH